MIIGDGAAPNNELLLICENALGVEEPCSLAAGSCDDVSPSATGGI